MACRLAEWVYGSDGGGCNASSSQSSIYCQGAPFARHYINRYAIKAPSHLI